MGVDFQGRDFMKKIFYLSCVLSLVCLGAGVCVSQDDVQASETVVTAGTMSFDYSNSVAVFETDVVVDDSQIRIESDKLTIYFNQTNDIKRAVAEGNVKVKRMTMNGTCRKVEYLADERRIIMTGDTVLNRDKDCLKGEKIIVWLDQEKVKCERGKLVIFPDSVRKTN